MKLNSLAARLLGAAAVVLLAFVALTGLALERAVRERALQAERDKLQGLTYALLGNAEIGADGGFTLAAQSLPEANFGRPGSGLYALVFGAEGQLLWRSPSVIDPIPLRVAPAVGDWRFVTPSESGGQWLKLAFGIRWIADNGKDYRYTLLVAESAAPFAAQLARFRGALWLWLTLAAGLLLAIQLAVLRWGLTPLRRLSRALGEIETGATAEIEGNFPAELRPLVASLNALLASEKARLERYRHALADLAHALKTPVAVLRGVAESSGPIGAKERKSLDNQLARINEIVDYQLQRAAAAGTRTLAPPVAVRPIAERLLGALRKVYAERAVAFSCDVPEQLRAAVDAGDLTEVLGNLLDNAAKYGRGHVVIAAQATPGGTEITVDDDGPGFPQDAARLLERGVRADSRREGQGIGLAVAAEIVRAYTGELRLEATPAGGARVRLRLP